MAGLDLQRIASAGLAIVDKWGAEGLTIRAVAEALEVTPMALYHHVQNKSALVALVVETALRERPLPIPNGDDWKEDLWEQARWVHESMRAHPAVARLRLEYNVWTPAALTLGEHWISLWQRSGLDMERAAQAALASSLAVVGVVHHELVHRDFIPPDDTALSWLPKMRFIFDADIDAASGFELLVRSVIDGLYARLAGSE
jgi:AcrR family transcriptional regulator